MFSTIRTVATSEEAESVISLLRARGFHPLDPDLSAHFSVSACATSYPIVVPREEEAAVASLLREQATSERTRSPKPQGARLCPPTPGLAAYPCSRCGGAMEEGFFSSQAIPGAQQSTVWVSRGKGSGALAGAGEQVEMSVRMFRCARCGMLETFAG